MPGCRGRHLPRQRRAVRGRPRPRPRPRPPPRPRYGLAGEPAQLRAPSRPALNCLLPAAPRARRGRGRGGARPTPERHDACRHAGGWCAIQKVFHPCLASQTMPDCSSIAFPRGHPAGVGLRRRLALVRRRAGPVLVVPLGRPMAIQANWFMWVDSDTAQSRTLRRVCKASGPCLPTQTCNYFSGWL